MRPLGLEGIGLSIAVVVAIGRFLDSEHFESETKDKARLGLIRIFMFLSDYPQFVRTFISNTIETWYSPGSNPNGGRPYWHYWSGLFLIWLAIFEISNFCIRYDIENREYHYGFFGPAPDSPWFGLIGAIFLAFVTPLIFACLIILFLIFTLPLSLGLLITVEMIRRMILIVLNKATSPRTSPFSYFTALLSAILALIGIVRYLIT